MSVREFLVAPGALLHPMSFFYVGLLGLQYGLKAGI